MNKSLQMIAVTVLLFIFIFPVVFVYACEQGRGGNNNKFQNCGIEKQNKIKDYLTEKRYAILLKIVENIREKIVGWGFDPVDFGFCPPIPNAVCGNGELEEGEECDDGNLTEGDGCDLQCQKERVMVTERFYPEPGDGYVQYQYNVPYEWDRVHDSMMGNSLNYTSATAGQVTSWTTGLWTLIQRAFYPFDTSLLPDDIEIISAELNIYLTHIQDYDNDDKDFLTVVQTSQASTSVLTKADFDNCGSVDNPIEGIDNSDRIDLSNIGINSYISFPLNATGIGWISKTGYTKLGIREGHDVLDESVDYPKLNQTSGGYSEAEISIRPYLDVTYLYFPLN